ncbi:MAG TPA: sulfatase-like hydrolase/transferase [Thermoanaerobaculia bacterium]|nr:sulfatase-like hydrolase/transferase [Thermoanaerobaculia bacterium]
MTKKRWAIVAIAVLLIVLLIGGAIALRSHRRSAPDIILITIDTLRADSLGFAGSTRVKTPYLDSLAARGTVFTNAHAHNVVTLPSHANILTGLYPYQHGLRDNAGFVLDANHPTLGAMMRGAGYATAAFVSAFPLDSRFGLNAGFDVYDDKYREAANPLDFVVQERPAEETLAAARNWYDSARGKKFLWIHLYDPHAPYEPPSPFREQYRDAPYYGEIAYVDDQLSRFLTPILEARPDTVVVITADHGEALGDHGELTHGLFAYESTLKVPLLILDPDRAPRKENGSARHVDLVPTILHRAGADVPSALPGHDLFGGLTTADSYFESLSTSLNRGWAPLVGLLHAGRKYIDLPLPELYDLAADPAEANNLANTDRRELFAMRKRLADAAPNPQATRGNVDASQKAVLMSLGYISGTAEKKEYTVADDPKNLIGVDNELHEAVALYQTGQLAKAIAALRAILAQSPDIKVAQEMLAFMLQQDENPHAAIEMLSQAVQSGAANNAMKVRLGLLLSANGQARQALEILRPYANTKDPAILNAYGIALADSGDLRGATETFHRVLAIDATNATAYQNLGVAALRAGDPVAARAHLAKALALNDRMPTVLNLMGVIEAKSGHDDLAIEWWRRAVRANPRLYDALYNLAVVASRAGRNDVARDALRQFIDTAPPQRYADDIAAARALLAQLNQ